MAVSKHPIIYPDEVWLDGGLLVPTHLTGELVRNRQFGLNATTGNLEYRVNGETRVVGQGVGTGGGLEYGGTLTGTGNAVEANKLYGINSQGVSGNVIMPENPEVGDRVGFVDLRANVATRNFTIRPAGSGEPIQNEVDDVVMVYDNQTIDFFYTGDPDAGWMIIGGSHLTGGGNGGGTGGNSGYTVKAELTGNNNATDVNSYYPVNATAGPVFAKFPENPAPGNVVHFSDPRGTLTANKAFTLQAADSGESFLGGTDEIFFNESYMSISWIFVSSSDGWMVLSGTHLAGSGGTVNLSGGSGGGSMAMRAALTGTDNDTVADSIYPIDASGGVVSAKFPENPTQGDMIHFVDLTASISEDNTFTLLAADSNEPFMQSTEALVMSATRLTQTWLYTGDAAAGWIIMGGSHLGGIIGGGGTGGGGTTPGSEPLTGANNSLREGMWERIDTRTEECRARMPESPEVGDIAEFVDTYGAFGDFPFVLVPALTGERIAGKNDSLTFVTPRQSVRFRYSGPEQGWVVVNAIIGGSPSSPFSGGLPFNILKPEVMGDASGAPGGQITLMATGAESAFSGEAITYEWQLPTGLVQVGPTVTYDVPNDNSLIGSTATFIVTARGSKGNTSGAVVHDVRILASQPPVMGTFTNTFPATALSGETFNITMSGASDPDGDDNLIRYEISEQVGVTAAKTAGIQAGEVVAITAVVVTEDQPMSIRVRARDEDNVVSSPVDVTGNLYAMGFVNKPTPTLPADGSLDVSVMPSFNAGAFSTTPATGANRTAVEVRIATDAGMANIIGQQTRTANTSTLDLTNGIPASTQVWYQMRYHSDNFGVSEWSDPISFTTGVASAVAGAVGVFRWTGGPSDLVLDTGMEHASNPWVMLAWTTVNASNRVNTMVSSDHPNGFDSHYQLAPSGSGMNEAGLISNLQNDSFTLKGDSSLCKTGQSYVGLVFMSEENVIDVVRYNGDGAPARDVPVNLDTPTHAAFLYNLTTGNCWYWNAGENGNSRHMETGLSTASILTHTNTPGVAKMAGYVNTNGHTFILVAMPEGSSTDPTAPMAHGVYSGNNSASGPQLASKFKPVMLFTALDPAHGSANPVVMLSDTGDVQTAYLLTGQETVQSLGSGNITFSDEGVKINTGNVNVNDNGSYLYTMISS